MKSLLRIPVTAAVAVSLLQPATVLAASSNALSLTTLGPASAELPEDATEEEKMVRAKQLYAIANAAYAAEDYETASKNFEQAYFLVPGKHGFAYWVAMSAFESGNCVQAKEYFDHFVSYGNKVKHAEKITESNKKLKWIESSGCATGGTPAAEEEYEEEEAELPVEEVGPVPEQGPDLSSGKTQREEAGEAYQSEGQTTRSPLWMAGMITAGVGAVAFLGGVSTGVLSKITVSRLEDHSSSGTKTGFPTGDYSLGAKDDLCKEKAGNCPYILSNRLGIYNLLTPSLIGGGLLALGTGGILLLRNKKQGGRGPVEAEPEVEEEETAKLRNLGPMLLPGGGGASATISF